MTKTAAKNRVNGQANGGELLDQKLPGDWLTEANLAGGVLLNPRLLDEPLGLHAGLFLHEDTRTVFNAIVQMKIDREPIDSGHVAMRLKRIGIWDKIGAERFAEIIQASVSPSLFQHYLDHARDLWKRRTLIFGGMKMVQAGHGRGSIDAQILELKGGLEALDGDGHARRLTYRTLTCAELADSAVALDYLVNGTLVAGQPMILAGPPKTLKTSIVTDLAVSLATGTDFLGVYQAPKPQRVVVMSGESGEAASRVCFRSVAEAKGYDLACVENLFWSDEVPRIGTVEHEIALRDHLRKYRPGVVVIDPAYRALSAARPEDMFQMGALLGSINDLCRSEGATFVLVHHSRKSTAAPFAPTTLDDLSWAGFREFFRQWILISRRSAYEHGSGVHELRLDVGGSARHSWCAAVTIDEGPFNEPRWAVTVRGLVESKEAEQEATDARRQQVAADKRLRNVRRLLDAAAKHPDGATKNQLREFAGLSGGDATSALAEALNAGQMVECEIRKGGRVLEGFKLGPGEAD